MSSKRKVKNEKSFGIGISVGAVVSLIFSLILAMIIAAFIVNERIGEGAIKYISPIIALIATMAGCVVATRLVGEKLAIVSGFTGIVYILILIGIGILFFDGGFHNLWTSVLSIAVGCAISCTICIRGNRSKTKRKRAYR